MPELPEVETIKRGLRKAVVGKRVGSLQVLEPRSFPDYTPDVDNSLAGAEVTDVQRRGKMLLFMLDNGLCLAAHLRMTGQLVYRAAVGTAEPSTDSPSDAPSGQNSRYCAAGAPPSGQNSRYCAAGEPPSGQNSRYCAVWGRYWHQYRPQTAQYLEFWPLGGAPAAQYLEFWPLGGAPAAQYLEFWPLGASPTEPSSGSAADFGGGFPSASLVRGLPDKSTRVVIGFEDGSRLFFNDQRKFGYLKLLDAAAIDDDAFIARLGPDPLDDAFNADTLKRALPMGSKRSIKAALLDQGVVAGIGNIYADESLFGAGIAPMKLVCSLSDAELERLAQSIVACLRLSIAAGGSTMRNYVDGIGQRGEYLDLHAQVFNRAGKPCARCGQPIEKTRVAGRGTHWCPRCQPHQTS